MPPAPVDIATFATTQLSLLSHELDAEVSQTADLISQASPSALQRAGIAVLNLHIASQRTGLGGKTVLELELDPAIGRDELPEHGLRVGDIVGVRSQVGGSAKKQEKAKAETEGVDGVMVKVSATALGVALDKEDADAPGGKLWIVKLANDVTYKRMNQTMKRLKELPESDQSEFIRVLFGQSIPTPLPSNLDEAIGKLEWVTDNLNQSQQDAIKFALASREIALIHGPPGTGKTHTLIELILQLLKKDLRILVCGPSNISVDNIVERLAPFKVPMVRLGHPARLLPSVLHHSLDMITKTSDAAGLVRDIRNEMDQKQASISKTRSGRERKAIYGEMRELRKEYRERERACVDDLVRTSKVVLATLHGAGGGQLRQARFDVVIIDEASQAMEAQCWVPLISAKKAVLAGDHLQLPPTVKSTNSKSKSKPETKAKTRTGDSDQPATTKSAKPTGDKPAKSVDERSSTPGNGDTPKSVSKEDGEADRDKSASLETTLFDRLLAMHGPSIKRMLTTQYRMHEKIMSFPSTELYDSKLVAAPTVKHRLLSQLPGVRETEDTTEPLIFYDTQGGDWAEKAEEENLAKNRSMAESKSNEMEAALVVQHVRKLVDAGLDPADIACITPYNAQLSILSQALKTRFPGIELGTVDGFQGREKEAVIFSLVRSNNDKEVGFLAEKRRLNVAMTRPRRQLVVIGDSETISTGGKFLKRWMAHLEEGADLRYPDPSELSVDLTSLKIGD